MKVIINAESSNLTKTSHKVWIYWKSTVILLRIPVNGPKDFIYIDHSMQYETGYQINGYIQR